MGQARDERQIPSNAMNAARLLPIPCMLAFLQLVPARAQQAARVPVSDRIESTSHNDAMRGAPRTLQYFPDGEDFVCVNGANRYTRAIYGSHTAWRVETSDRPIFATYSKGNCRNVRFRLALPDGGVTPLEGTSLCEARYRPGSRIYSLGDGAWGDGRMEITLLASLDEETAIWRVAQEGMPPGCTLEVILSDVRNQELTRGGDMGLDAPDSFDPREDTAPIQSLALALPEGGELFVAVSGDGLRQEEDPGTFRSYEEARRALASRVRVETPDPYLNTLGGALAVAADGIWGTEGVWLHGAVGWRMPLSGWRAAYAGDALGWHDRAREHFDNYAASQVTGVPCVTGHPAQDSTLALARSVKRWGTPQYSNGYICRNPRRNDQMHHYDMNLCYMDELLWHLNWTGDLDYARRMWDVIVRHLEWEKLNFDPDDDGLYDAYACIWASDALYYDSGGVTHSTAYNYRANSMAAMIAGMIGEDPAPFRREADRILSALNGRLWLADRGHWAEFRDLMGHGAVHPDAALWTIYHAIDSDAADPFQAYEATRYVDRKIPHIPVRVDVVPEGLEALADGINSQGCATVSTSDWMPYSWSINNVAFAEVMHTALAYFEAGRPDEGLGLLRSSVLDGMYLGSSPGNFGQVSFYDAARGECYRDFGDPIGVASRVLVQGLYGVLPDALNKRLLIRPGFPVDWERASLHTPDIDLCFRVEQGPDGSSSVFSVRHGLDSVRVLELRVPVLECGVRGVTVNGEPSRWEALETVGHPSLSVTCVCCPGDSLEVRVNWAGGPIQGPGRDAAVGGPDLRREGPYTFARTVQGDFSWWAEVGLQDGDPDDGWLAPARASVVIGDAEGERLDPVRMDGALNACVTDIFRNEYLSPRSPYTTLQIPVQGIGEWCHPLMTADIDDGGVRSAVRGNVLTVDPGIPFRSFADGNNIAFTSLFDNYPDSVSIPLKGKASCAYLLMAGSTNHMQCRIPNAVVRVHYKDGTTQSLPLVNPVNWSPIEQAFFEDGLAFDRGAPPMRRLALKTGRASDSLAQELGVSGAACPVDGGAAVLLRMPLDPGKRLSSMVVETLANEVVVGIMGVTLGR